MIIKITNYPVGIHEFEFVESTKELQLDDKFVDNLILDCKLDKSQHQIVLNCNLTISVKLNCDRCTEDFKTQIQSDFSLIYLFDKNDDKLDDSNVKFLSPTDDKIDLTQDVIDFANLSLPMKNLCSEDCKGLCSHCGTNLNLNSCNCKEDEVNPIWDSLKSLKDKLN